MKSKIITIIVPVYNLEKYIENSLCSTAYNESEEIEVVVVDDGSLDNSNIIISEYSLCYDNVYFVNKANGGVSEARNVGLKLFLAKYILFLDGDDWLEFKAIDMLCQEAYERDYDSVGYDFECVKQNCLANEVNEGKRLIEKKEYIINDARDISDIIEKRERDYSYSSQRFILLGSVIKNNALCFAEDVCCGEDLLFIRLYLLYVRRMAILHGYGCYKYRQYDTSCLHRYVKSSMFIQQQNLLSINHMISYLSKRKKLSYGGKVVALTIWENMINIMSQQKDDKNQLNLFRKSHKTLLVMMLFSPYRRKILSFIYLLFPKLYKKVIF